MTQNLTANEAQSLAKLEFYLAAKEAAEVVKAALDSSKGQEYDDTNGSIYAAGEKRVQLALDILKIAWASKS